MVQKIFLLTALAVIFFPVPALCDDEVTILAYHDIRDDRSTGTGLMTITTQTLIDQFSWLREQGYRVISVNELIAAKERKKPLPEKAVLLTFDDGYVSVYTTVFPLLKLFKYPAVIALVGKWMDTRPNDPVLYGNEKLPRERFLTWNQVREMVESGYVEVASHTYDLHKGIAANPQGNEEPAATSLAYFSNEGRYERSDEYEKRLISDLETNSRLIESRTGKKPRVMIWPYGSFSRPVLSFARSLGMEISMGLEPGHNHSADLSALHRIPIADNSDLPDLVWTLRNPDRPRSIRAAQVDLDYVYDPDPGRQERNLGLLLDRVKQLGINTVYLQAFSDPEGKGIARALYFPNRRLPVRADLFNRVSWQLQKRTGVQVYAWMPVLSFDFGNNPNLSHFILQEGDKKKGKESGARETRLSPFQPEVRQAIGDLYEDLGRYASFTGILFHDDAYLTDFEDASPRALDFYATEWGLPRSIQSIRNSPEASARWREDKTAYLVDLTKELAGRAAKFRPELKTARNIYAEVVRHSEAEAWYGQSVGAFLKNYDYTVVMAMPFLENESNSDAWLQSLVGRIAQFPGGLSGTLFELQSVDWKRKAPVGSRTLLHQMELLQAVGAMNIGYYPEDFVKGYPEISVITPGISLNADPYK